MRLVFKSNIFHKRIMKNATREKDGVTRNAILDRLKRSDPITAGAIGEQLGLTAMAVRLHLYELEAEGLVAATSKPAGRGRPVKLWGLTDAAARVFPDAHQGVAVEMINSVRALFGEDGLAAVIARHGERQRAQYKDRLNAFDDLKSKVKTLAEIRSSEGYMAEAIEQDGGWLLVENHCPVCTAAKACAGLCANELAVFRDVMGPRYLVERTDHILAGARRCAYQITPNAE